MQPHLHRPLLSKGKAFSNRGGLCAICPLASPRLPSASRLHEEPAPLAEPSAHLWPHKDQVEVWK